MLIRNCLIPLMCIGFVAVADSGVAAAQELPRQAVIVAFQQVMKGDDGTLLIATEHFPSPKVAGEAARSLGLGHSLLKSTRVRCTADKRSCEIIGGDRIIAFYGVARTGDGLAISLIVSSEFKLPNGNTRMFPTLRRIVVGRRENRWFVVKDEVLTRG